MSHTSALAYRQRLLQLLDEFVADRSAWQVETGDASADPTQTRQLAIALKLFGQQLYVRHDLEAQPHMIVVFFSAPTAALTQANDFGAGLLRANLYLGAQAPCGWCCDAAGTLYYSEGFELDRIEEGGFARVIVPRCEAAWALERDSEQSGN